jgi:hypothetical protein
VAGISRLEGGWTSRTWVPYRHRVLHLAETCQVLIGTRALLGEGLGCTGGDRTHRPLDRDHSDSCDADSRARTAQGSLTGQDKVALNWTVVCISSRVILVVIRTGISLVRKHDGFFGTDSEGEIVDGVAHIDPAFSAFQPPEDDSFDAINARMTARSQSRTEVAQRWDIGADYRDEELRSVRILACRTEEHRRARVRPPSTRCPRLADTTEPG